MTSTINNQLPQARGMSATDHLMAAYQNRANAEWWLHKANNPDAATDECTEAMDHIEKATPGATPDQCDELLTLTESIGIILDNAQKLADKRRELGYGVDDDSIIE